MSATKTAERPRVLVTDLINLPALIAQLNNLSTIILYNCHLAKMENPFTGPELTDIENAARRVVEIGEDMKAIYFHECSKQK